MKTKEAVQRLAWRFKQSPNFNINQNDIEALNTIIDFYENTATENARSNDLAFKMYVWHRIELMKHYNEDILGTQTQKIIGKALSQPSQMYIQRFTEYINQNEIKELVPPPEDDGTPFFMLTEAEKDTIADQVAQQYKDGPEDFKLAGWTEKEVKENLILEFNQLIQVI